MKNFRPIEDLVKESQEGDIVEIRALRPAFRGRGLELETGLIGYLRIPNKIEVKNELHTIHFREATITWSEGIEGYGDKRKILGYRILGNSSDLKEKREKYNQDSEKLGLNYNEGY